MKKQGRRIVFLSPYPFDTAPGQRFRYEQYYGILKKNGFSIQVLSFLSPSVFKVLYKKGHVFRKAWGILSGYFRRLFHLFKIISCDYVFIYREAAPLGYPVFEWIIAKVLRKKIVYDFDDAIWLPGTSEENKIANRFKYPQKVALICKWAYKVSVGNEYLREYALKYNKQSVLNPTTIDTEHCHNRIKAHGSKPVVIGWTGSHSTLGYLYAIYPVLKKLDREFDFIFEVIADKEISFDLKKFSFVKWSRETEIEDLIHFHIGIMPLPDDEWAKGKCGFKALQYMALGIPAVISPVGVNRKIVSEGIDGFLAASEKEWYEKLSVLIQDASLRENIGRAAIAKVRNNYSVLSNTSNFLSLFD